MTNKEMKIAQFLVEGLTNVEISKKEFISINTVKTHVKNLYLKLNVHNRAELVSRFLMT